MKNKPTHEELILIVKKLNYKPIELVRQKEPIWIEKYKNKPLSDDEIIKAMIQNPILIERPIVISGDKAFVAKDLEKLSTNYLE